MKRKSDKFCIFYFTRLAVQEKTLFAKCEGRWTAIQVKLEYKKKLSEEADF